MKKEKKGRKEEKKKKKSAANLKHDAKRSSSVLEQKDGYLSSGRLDHGTFIHMFKIF